MTSCTPGDHVFASNDYGNVVCPVGFTTDNKYTAGPYGDCGSDPTKPCNRCQMISAPASLEYCGADGLTHPWPHTATGNHENIAAPSCSSGFVNRYGFAQGPMTIATAMELGGECALTSGIDGGPEPPKTPCDSQTNIQPTTGGSHIVCPDGFTTRNEYAQGPYGDCPADTSVPCNRCHKLVAESEPWPDVRLCGADNTTQRWPITKPGDHTKEYGWGCGESGFVNRLAFAEGKMTIATGMSLGDGTGCALTKGLKAPAVAEATDPAPAPSSTVSEAAAPAPAAVEEDDSWFQCVIL